MCFSDVHIYRLSLTVSWFTVYWRVLSCPLNKGLLTYILIRLLGVQGPGLCRHVTPFSLQQHVLVLPSYWMEMFKRIAVESFIGMMPRCDVHTIFSRWNMLVRPASLMISFVYYIHLISPVSTVSVDSSMLPAFFMRFHAAVLRRYGRGIPGVIESAVLL
jgi:hypothetical protein